MVETVAQALAKLAQRERFTDDDDRVFPGIGGDFLDGSALRRRYKDAIKYVQTTSRYLHHKSQSGEARLPADAFRVEVAPQLEAVA